MQRDEAEGKVRELSSKKRIACTIPSSETQGPAHMLALEEGFQESAVAPCWEKWRPLSHSHKEPDPANNLNQHGSRFFPESPNKSPADQLLDLDLWDQEQKPVKPSQISETI